MTTQGSSTIAVVAAITGNLIIAIIKFAAAAITGSSAMISEGIHSLVDTGNGGLVLLGMNRARQPADESHPFGHGKSLYFWTHVVAVSIFGIGGGMSLYEGIIHILHVTPAAELGDPTVAYIVLAISFLVEGGSFSVAMKQFLQAKGNKGAWQFINQSKDPSIYTVVLEDSAALLGLIFAFLGIFFGHLFNNAYLDGVASIAIGLLLMSVAGFLASRTRGLLLGEGVNPDELADIRRRVESDPAVESAGDILTMYMGPHDLLVNMGVRFTPGTTAEQMHEAIRRIEADLHSAYPETNRVYIEAESLPATGVQQRLPKV
ncbi:cation diffusion facilitator family transporter [Methanosphaerula palustris E1-9c]|uniref:Cation diffusion facilitator family transporter n=2 Tax=Methanosphaerula palustris TaxID=475088 RepID=B8GG11_METPE|nr:cation diffusion facilitator family transporter [Methanosphaerula palustris E1-9c]